MALLKSINPALDMLDVQHAPAHHDNSVGP
jgi:hypothetical protein